MVSSPHYNAIDTHPDLTHPTTKLKTKPPQAQAPLEIKTPEPPKSVTQSHLHKMYTTALMSPSTLPLLFLLLLPPLLTLPLLTLSAPAPAPQGVEVRLIGAYYCTGTQWTGGCAFTEAIHRNCVNIFNPAGTAFSFGPSPGLVCKLYEEADCHVGGTVVGGIVYPGWPDVGAVTQNEGLGVVKSWMCESVA